MRKLTSNMANVVTTTVRKCVPPLHTAPSSERIVKPTYDLLAVRLSVTTIVLRTANIAVMRCAERPQCGAKWRQTRQTSRIFAVQLCAKNDQKSNVVYNGRNSKVSPDSAR